MTGYYFFIKTQPTIIDMLKSIEKIKEQLKQLERKNDNR